MRPSLRIGTVYDFRNTAASGLDTPSLYSAIIDQIEMLDRIGLDLVWFTEHHFLDDGYLPSWIPVAAAIAMRTRHVRISSDVCLLPFNHPIRLAEDLAVLDNLSNGRIEVGVGMGYAPHEFRGFGLPVSRRVSLTDEGIEVLRRCFTGERFSFHGKRYTFDDVVIRPGYVQQGGPPLWVAAMSEAGAQRAARFDSHLLPQGPRAAVLDPWRAALAGAGRDPQNYRVGIIRSCLVTDDVERDWPPVRAAGGCPGLC
jgi:alkanesulfonate monooxygenase SsuD/methylene tetrahydromethanopterin reductase-like flavin-dependent oxidoreductase (luciferase family)